ncbi:hypothetical protein LCGC14_2936870, partial [marine sediment metagenome]
IHKDLCFTLHPRLNVFVGPTDGGKSAFVRAMRWALLNIPLGDQFVRYKTDEAIVTIRWEDLSILKRSKGTGINRITYEHGQVDLDYNQFGRDIPDTIVQALGLAPTELSGEQYHLSFGMQMEPAFMLAGWTGAARSAVLDGLCGNDLVVSIVKSLNKDVQKFGRDRNGSQERIKEHQNELAQFKTLDDDVRKLQQVEALMVEFEASDKILCQIDHDLTLAEDSIEWVETRDKILDGLKEIPEVDHDPIEKMLDDLDRVEKVLKKCLDYREYDRDKREAEVENKGIEKLARIELEDLLKECKTCPLCFGELTSKCIEGMLADAVSF